MKHYLFVFILASSPSLYGQVQQAGNVPLDAYKEISEVSVVYSIDPQNLVGNIIMNYGLSGQRLFLDSNMTYQLFSRHCLGEELIRTGTWQISFGRMLKLVSTKGSEFFSP